MLKVLRMLIYTFFSERVNETIMQILFRWTVKKLQVKIIKKEYYSILETGQWKVKLHVESKVDKEVGEKKVRFKRTDAAQYHPEDKTTQLLNKFVKTVHKACQLKFGSVGRPWEMHVLFAKATDPRCKSWLWSQVLWSLYEERWSLLNWGWGSAMKLFALPISPLPLSAGGIWMIPPPSASRQPPWRSGEDSGNTMTRINSFSPRIDDLGDRKNLPDCKMT